MTKIEALEKTIYNLENDVYEYMWGDFDTCNCGLLATTILNGQRPRACGFYNVSPRNTGTSFGNALFSSRTHCINTGIELPTVFKALKEAGFSHEDLMDLEFLKNKNILSRIAPLDKDRGVREYEIKSNLINYLRAWVEILKEKDQKPERVKTVYVSVPETIKEQTGELILS